MRASRSPKDVRLLAAVLDPHPQNPPGFPFYRRPPRSRPPSRPFRKAPRRCQDFAHLQIGCIDLLGLPARYVSGYLRQSPPPGHRVLVGGRTPRTPGVGMVPRDRMGGFRSTNNCAPSDGHIPWLGDAITATSAPSTAFSSAGAKHNLQSGRWM